VAPFFGTKCIFYSKISRILPVARQAACGVSADLVLATRRRDGAELRALHSTDEYGTSCYVLRAHVWKHTYRERREEGWGDNDGVRMRLVFHINCSATSRAL